MYKRKLLSILFQKSSVLIKKTIS